jgi:DNA helicase-2/ATP-dependent DNA helicase PcrA
MFKRQPGRAQAEYQRRFRYMLVDEYQDTNTAQYLWLRLLAQGNPNICCVGDDDQSIYGWRGAEVDNILRFEQDFPGAKSSGWSATTAPPNHILAAASHLIAHNEGRLGKTLFTDSPMSTRTKVHRRIRLGFRGRGPRHRRGDRRPAAQGPQLNDMAILVRASFQMREFEDRFVTLGLNYRVIGGPRFYERMEIRDAMAYLRVRRPARRRSRLRAHRQHAQARPRRGDGALVHDYARANRIPLLQAPRRTVQTEELRPKPRTR